MIFRLFLLFNAFFFSFFGCISTEYGIASHRQDIFLYSTEKEVAIGYNLAEQLRSNLKFSHDPLLLKKVRSIGEKIAKVCDRQEINYYFNVIHEDEYNAFSLPGGYVYIYDKLAENLTDNELAFVLAHEIAHIVARHSIKKLQAAMGMNILILASTQAEAEPGFTQGLSFALGQIFTAYSREDEFQADELACKYLKLAGYAPDSGINVLEKLYQHRKSAPLSEYSYFRTHPYTAQRIKHIKEILGIPLSVSDYLN